MGYELGIQRCSVDVSSLNEYRSGMLGKMRNAGKMNQTSGGIRIWSNRKIHKVLKCGKRYRQPYRSLMGQSYGMIQQC
jgi:hypothetical protein